MAGIPEDIIERVKAEASIVDVISDYVRLRRTGKNWTGLCPFHDDKRPSFAVEPVRGIYKCFSCGKGGNVFTFLMEHNGWSFPETVRGLAERLGIEIPTDPVDREEYSENERLAAAVRDAAKFFYRTLRSETGVAAFAYFRQRGFSEETIRRFGLGYAPDEWSALLQHLEKAGYEGAELEKAGLVIPRKDRSGWYDRFRGRAMFPIFTATGRLVGFGARRMNEDPDQPKYINSPESPIYHKSRVLYGLFQAKDAIRKAGRALMVEGYADVISLHQAGIETAIAPCGTSLANEHAELIGRYATRVVLIFDSDAAGKSATERGIDILLRRGLDVSVLRLPDGEDPDTFVRKFGVGEFERRLEESISFLEFRVRTMKQAGDFDVPDRQAEAIRSVVETIALIPDDLKRELYIQKLARDYHLPETLLLREVATAIGRQQRGRRRDLYRKSSSGTPPAASVDDVPPPESPDAGTDAGPAPDLEVEAREGESSALRRTVARSDVPSAELGLLRVLMIGDPQMLEHVFARIDPNDFSHPVSRELVELVLAHYVEQRSFSLDTIEMEKLPDEVRDMVTLLAVEQESISDYWTKIDPELGEPNPWRIARDCLVRIEQERISREFYSEQEKLSDPELDDEKMTLILARLKELSLRKQELEALMRG